MQALLTVLSATRRTQIKAFLRLRLSACIPCSGGLTNVLYVACLPKHLDSQHDEPTKVMLRFYGMASGDPDAILKDSLVFALLADRGIGPRLYGCFAGGRFEEYIPVSNKKIRTK